MTNIVSQKELKLFISTTNGIITDAIDQVGDAYPTLGPLFGEVDGMTAFKLLSIDRLRGKWARPDQSVVRSLTTKCFDDWIAHEEYLWTFPVVKNIYNGNHKGLHFKAKDLLRSWLKGFKPDFKRIEFTPGASFFKTDNTSIYRKLSDLKHWTVTIDALSDALDLICEVSALRNCAAVHLQQIAERGVFVDIQLPFRELVELHVLTIVDGARGSSVYKNNTKRRFINIEATFNMLLQRCVAHSLRKILLAKGNDLERGQDHHQAMIKDLTYATIDFANASDSVHLDWVEWLLADTPIFQWLLKYRSYYTIIPRENNEEEYFVNKKLSAMGNGFTFEVMTLLLLAYARVLDSTARVYGDDVVIRRDAAPMFVGALEECSWKCNTSKTFVSGSFRESCGSFFHGDFGYMHTYDFRYAESAEEAIILINKMRRIKDVHPDLAKAYDRLLQKTPALLKGPMVGDVPCSRWVETPSYQRAKRSDEKSRSLWKKHSKVISFAETLWQKKVVAVNPQLLYIAQKVELGVDIECVFTFYTYLYSSMVSDDVIRGKGKWRQFEALIFEDGSTCLVSHVYGIAYRGVNSQRRKSELELFRSRFINSTNTPFYVAVVHP